MVRFKFLPFLSSSSLYSCHPLSLFPPLLIPIPLISLFILLLPFKLLPILSHLSLSYCHSLLSPFFISLFPSPFPLFLFSFASCQTSSFPPSFISSRLPFSFISLPSPSLLYPPISLHFPLWLPLPSTCLPGVTFHPPLPQVRQLRTAQTSPLITV